MPPAESPAAPCPDDEALLRFVDGARDGATAAHVRGCNGCQQAVAAFLCSEAPGADATEDGLIAWIERAQKQRAAALASGAKVQRYEIVRRVGSGGMGIVYAARDPELDRRVAIKIMHPSDSAAGDENRRLLREARALAKVSHPHVVAVHDVGTVDGRVFVAMELIDGPTLRQWLLGERSVDAIVQVFLQAGRGLAAAHDAGLVHRDFKPDNVLIGADGRVRVTDFGLARTRDHSDSQVTRSKGLVGTPSYMAPEVLNGELADARSDQYSFGVALHRALAGATGGSGAALPRRLRKLVRRAACPDRAGRFGSMSQLVAELEACRRAPWRRITAIVAAAATAAALATWLLGARAETRDAPEATPAAPAPSLPKPSRIAPSTVPSSSAPAVPSTSADSKQEPARAERPPPRPAAPPASSMPPDPLSEW